MKELIKKMKNNKGISLITLTVAVSILIIITSTLIYNAKDTLEVANLKNMYNDIELLEDKVEQYFIEYGAIPATLQYTNTGFLNGENAEIIEDDVKNPIDDNKYYVIDLAVLDGITTLNYGRHYEKVKDKSSLTAEECNQNTDIYIINKVSNQIYYVRGVESDGKTYYTNELKTQNDDINMKITVIDSIEDLVRFEQKVNDSEAAKTFKGENVVLTRNLDFEDNNSYDGSTVIIKGTSYSFNWESDETSDLKAYLCKNDSDPDKVTGWIPIGNYTDETINNQFSGTFDGKGYKISNIYINSSSYYQGLFGFNTGTIQNLSIENGSITGEQYVGGICGENRGTIKNCNNYGTSIIGSVYVGGICGEMQAGSIEDCRNEGNISGSTLCGGIVGHMYNATIDNCYNVGNVTTENRWSGGICGANRSTIQNCYNIGNVTRETEPYTDQIYRSSRRNNRF